MGWYAGIDLGATNVRALVADETGDVAGRDRRPTPQGPTGDAIAGAVVETFAAACAEAGVATDALAGVGIGSMGPLDRAAGAVDDPPNLTVEVGRIPLVDPVADAADGAPVSLWNDAVAGVHGERRFAEGGDDLVYLTVSSGIGAGVAIDGVVPTGWNGNVAEVGHFVVDPSGARTCGCGGVGHWEAYCAGANVPDFARDVAAELDVETSLALDSPDFAAVDVFAAAGDDPLADAVIERMGRYHAVGVANLVHAFAPRRVVVGGAVATNNPEAVLGPVRERLPGLLATDVPELTITELGDDAVALGALAGVLPG